jgi:hypothetical protein
MATHRFPHGSSVAQWTETATTYEKALAMTDNDVERAFLADRSTMQFDDALRDHQAEPGAIREWPTRGEIAGTTARVVRASSRRCRTRPSRQRSPRTRTAMPCGSA